MESVKANEKILCWEQFQFPHLIPGPHKLPHTVPDSRPATAIYAVNSENKNEA